MLTETTISTSAPVAQERLHLDYVDGLRAVAALMVILDHVYFQAYTSAGHHSATRSLFHFFVFGHLGVPIFLVISGFCLMLPVARNGGSLRGGFRVFLRRRAHRILPPYYFAVGACLFLNTFVIDMHAGEPYDTSAPVTWSGMLSHLLMLQDLFAMPQINAVFWSLAVEWKIYFLFPVLLLGWKLFGPWLTVFLCGILGALLFYWISPHFDRACPQYIALFSFGMLSATLCCRETGAWPLIYRRTPWALLAAGMALALAAACKAGGVAVLGDYRADYLAGGFAACLLLGASKPGIFSRVLSWKPLVFIGTFSYSLYMMHMPLMQIFCQRFLYPFYPELGADGIGILTMLVGIPFMIAWAFLFFLVFEHPFLNRRPVPQISAAE